MLPVVEKTDVAKDVFLVPSLLGKVIKRHRKKKIWIDGSNEERFGMSQEELALRSEISINYMSQIEQGKYNPSINTLFKIANALGVPLSQIIAEVEEEMETETD